MVDARSTTGFVVRVYGCPAPRRARKQKCVTRSSTHAEYYAMADAAEEVNYIRGILNDLNVESGFIGNVKMYEDNSGALALTKNGNFTKKSRAFHFVFERVKSGVLDVRKIPSADNL